MAAYPVMPDRVHVAFPNARQFEIAVQRIAVGNLSPRFGEIDAMAGPIALDVLDVPHQQGMNLRPFRFIEHRNVGPASPAIEDFSQATAFRCTDATKRPTFSR